MLFRCPTPTLFTGLFAPAQVRHAAHWGPCVHCHRTTPWYVDAQRHARCTACGGAPLAA